mmetsp:Transcript_12766/g.50981  ORF Transcript_12766/g.50981 Transcript_12766/m.50981 type:complete len:270 (+) Transcript_12766:124-933(+)
MYGATSGSRGGGYQGGYGLDGQEAAVPPLVQCKANIGQIQVLGKRVQELTVLVGTASDTEQLREELRGTRENAVDLIRETADIIQQPCAPSEQQQKNMLMDEFQRSVAECRQHSQASIQKVASFPLQKSYNPYSGQGGAPAGNNLMQYQEQAMLPDDLDLVEVKELDIDNRIINERNEGLHDLNERLGDLKEIYKDTAKLVEVQQPMFEQAEQNAAKSANVTKHAVAHLEAAQKYQGKGRGKQCMIIVCLLGMVLVVALIIALFVGLAP